MSTRAFYHPRSLRVDLAQLPASLYEEIASLRGHISRNDPPVLTCMGNGQPMHVYRHSSGRFFARHFPGGNQDGHIHPIARMSAQHERQAEYCRRAAVSAGFPAELEVSTGAGTRLDVAVRGPVPTGLEIQRSFLSVAQAKSRTTKSAKAGFTCAWISDQEKDPHWVDHVPTARLTTRGGYWDSLPPAGSANVVIGRFIRERDNRSASGWWYTRQPFPVTLDELSYLMPAGEIIPVQIGNEKKRRVVLADRSAAEVIDSCTYPGAAAWQPNSVTLQPRETAQRYSSDCVKHGESATRAMPTDLTQYSSEPMHRHQRQMELPTITAQMEFLALKSRGFRPPSGPNRCPSCAFHTPTQGHREGCPANQKVR